MRISATRTLHRFWERHPTSKPALQGWVDEVRQARWHQPADIKASYASASFLGQRQVVFNIKGNDYRLIAAIAYGVGVVDVK